jgi:hypothetical protein
MSAIISFNPIRGHRWNTAIAPAPTADEFRRAGRLTWHYDPFTGRQRDPRDVERDPRGFEIAPPIRMTKWVPTTDLMMLRRMGKTLEELGELVSVAARCIIQGIDEVDPGSGKINRDRLIDETADVLAQCQENIDRLGLSRERIEARSCTKRGYMQEWEAMFESEANRG